jgi:long-subunit fatty acid transport protein
MQRSVLKVILISFSCCVALLAFAFNGYSQPLVRMEIPSSFNPVGSGARALGMGGAFIAVADDATAASWNPGGLIQLEKPEISVVGGYVKRMENNTFGNNPEASGKQPTDDIDLNYLSVAYPFNAANHNMIVSLNYQRLYDFMRSWNISLDVNNPLFTSTAAYQYEQKGALYALGLAYSLEITPRFSAGITLNYWGDFIRKNEWELSHHMGGNVSLGGVPGTFKSEKTDTYAFSGWNANLGFLWKMTEHWTLGGVFKTPFTASVDHRAHDVDTMTYPTFPPANTYSVKDRSSTDELRMPMSYGLGVAYRFSDRLTLSSDLYRTHWADFIYESEQGVRTSPISGKPEGSSDIVNTTWFRLGGEYLIIGADYVVPLRAGIFYDPAPADGSPDNYYGFALGSGISYGRFVFDVAYQFRFGNNVGASTLRSWNFSQDVREHTIYTSMIVHF